MEEIQIPAEEPVPAAAAAEKVTVVDVQFRPGQKVYFFDPDGLTCAAGDHVIMDTARGEEYGIVTAGNHEIRAADIVSPLRKIMRMATPRDERTNAENREKEKRAFEICTQKAAQHGLDMQTVSAECAFDGSKILFFFTADERVDFRELVKDLASVFHTRIELRQIGVRDKARMVGGLGICGRPFCCASFLEDFQPVSIKMAKTQNLSLNPVKISGTCGRLMCCLKYEQDTYEELQRRCPKAESFVDTPEGRGTVVDCDILRQLVKVSMENNPGTVSVFGVEDIAVLRSGRARRNDPPIPTDLAPISGSGRQPARQQPEKEAQPALAPIRFRYSTESIVDETPDAAPAPEETPASAETAAVTPAAEEPPAVEAAEVPAAPAREHSGERPPRQRNRPPRKPRPERPQNPAPEEPQGEPSAAEAEKPAGEKHFRGPRPNRPRGGRRPEGQRDGRQRQEPRPAPEAPAPQTGTAAPSASDAQSAPAASGERKPYHHRRRPRGPRPGGGTGGNPGGNAAE